MTQTRNELVGLVVALAVFAPGRAVFADTTLENTAAACQDGIDNDGDTFTDCTDQDCSYFVFCQGTGAVTTPAPTAEAPSEPSPPAAPEAEAAVQPAAQPEVSQQAVEVPVGWRAQYKVTGQAMNSKQLRRFLLEQPPSAELAKKSKKLNSGGWAMVILGAVFIGAGAGLVGVTAGDLSIPLLISGIASMVVGGALFLVGKLALIRKGWRCLGEAIKAYNTATPAQPILPGFSIHDY